MSKCRVSGVGACTWILLNFDSKERIAHAIVATTKSYQQLIRAEPSNFSTDSLTEPTESVQELKQQPDIRRALKQSSSAKPERRAKPQKAQAAFLGTYIVFLMVSGGIYYLLRFNIFNLNDATRAFLQRTD